MLRLHRHRALTVPYDHAAFLYLRWRIFERLAQRVLFREPEGGVVGPGNCAQIWRAVATVIRERSRQATSEGRVELDRAVLPDCPRDEFISATSPSRGEGNDLLPKESRSGKVNEGASESVLLLLEIELEEANEWVGACCACGGVTEAVGTKTDAEEERETGRRVAQWIVPVRGSSCSSEEEEEESSPSSLGVGRRTNPDTDDSASEAVSAALSLQEICPSCSITTLSVETPCLAEDGSRSDGPDGSRFVKESDGSEWFLNVENLRFDPCTGPS